MVQRIGENFTFERIGRPGEQGTPPPLPPEVKEQLKSAGYSDEQINQAQSQGPEVMMRLFQLAGIQPPSPEDQDNQSSIFDQQNGGYGFNVNSIFSSGIYGLGDDQDNPPNQKCLCGLA